MTYLTIEQARALSPLTLAFYGDCIYELLVRHEIVMRGSQPSAKLHKTAVERVRASAQAVAYDKIEPLLSEQELDVMKRGRNASGATVPRSSNPHDYRRATGIEALFGFLYITGQNDRVEQLYEVISNGEKKD